MKKLANLFFVAFLFILIIPSLTLKQTDNSNCENRSLTASLDFSFSQEFFKDFETFYIDHLGFKTYLTTLNASLKYLIFNSSSHPQFAVTGKNNWAFYTDNTDRILDSYSHQDLLTQDSLESLRLKWEKRKSDLKAMGIDFYIAVYPNKSTIYNNNVPFNMKWTKRDTCSKLNQVINHFKLKSSPIEIIQFKNELMAQKDTIDNYLKFDTHWNDLGCFTAYQKLCKSIQINPHSLSDLNLTHELFKNPDLGRLSGLCNSKLSLYSTPIINYKDSKLDFPKDTAIDFITCWKNPDLTKTKTLLVFMDSYTNNMEKLLALHFKECYFVPRNYYIEIIQETNPDIVIIANVERYFATE
ncbi:MAG: hypothetical protein RJQ00_05160 [Vicingaceae bacterium]